MNRHTRFVSALAITACALLGLYACDDDAPTETGDESGLEFTYDGGSYRSEGMPAIGQDGLPEIGSWAVARADSLGGLVIAGFQPTEGSKGDLFILQLHPIRTGEFSPCGVVGVPDCHGRFIVGVDKEDFAAVDAYYEITSGSVTLSEASTSRVAGTFSAVFTRLDDGSGDTFTVDDGVIDVPFSSDVSLANGLACLARNLEDGTNEPC